VLLAEQTHSQEQCKYIPMVTLKYQLHVMKIIQPFCNLLDYDIIQSGNILKEYIASTFKKEVSQVGKMAG
jgi:hypothetical protein